jgi:hypothetical protein
MIAIVVKALREGGGLHSGCLHADVWWQAIGGK